jgi:tRNA 2-thiouridine synthesizing protein C
MLVRRTPYAGALAYEMLEAALVAGVFEQAVTLAFLDDGVYQLLRNQNAAALGMRNLGHGLRALDAYDVKNLLVDVESLRDRGLTIEDLEVAVRVVDAEAIRALIPAHDVVMTA